MTILIPEYIKTFLAFLNHQDLSGNQEDVLVSFAQKIENTNITLLIDPILTLNKKVFYFDRPEEDISFLAFEETLSLKFNGMNRFTALGNQISLISKKQINNFDKYPSIKFPLFLGGNKFCTGKNSDEWNNFADNDWFIPQFMFYKKDNDVWLVFHYLTNKNSPTENSLNSLFDQIIKLNNNKFISPEDFGAIHINKFEKEHEEWNHLISDALSKIEDNFFRKVVISRRMISCINHYPSFSYVSVKLRENYNNCTIFLYKSENSILFGATPEQLLKLKGNGLEFDALAGSAKRGNTEEDDKKIASSLLKDKKNTEEHNHVIDFIKNTSSPYVKNLIQFDTGIKKFSNIQHIYTPIRAELKSSDQIYDLIEAIFPTPAICGYPKVNSFNYIIDNEKFDRGLFSGIIGFISPGEIDLVVAIRSALLNDNKLYIYAGCGIVKDSNPISEFEETEIKMRPILSLFNNENQ